MSALFCLFLFFRSYSEVLEVYIPTFYKIRFNLEELYVAIIWIISRLIICIDQLNEGKDSLLKKRGLKKGWKIYADLLHCTVDYYTIMERQLLHQKVRQIILVMKTNTSVFVVFKTKHELKCQFSGIIECVCLHYWDSLT